MGKIAYAKRSLLGISIGDAFGDSFFGEEAFILDSISQRKIPETRWEFTDDTVMAIALYRSLEMYEHIDQDFVAKEFGENYALDFERGYGPSMHRRLRGINEGLCWKEITDDAFGGEGSMGNGGAMRSALIGAYFHEDLQGVKKQAALSSAVTHAHQEGIIGTMAIALATAIVTNNNGITPHDFLQKIIDLLPDSDTRSKINKATHIPANYDIRTVVSILGNGIKMTAPDTVPIALWLAAHNLDNFEDALWKSVAALGDRDTICAMVGGIVIMTADEHTIPKEWSKSVESWETSKFYKK